MAIISRLLLSRKADVEAVSGVSATRIASGGAAVAGVFTSAGDPREAEAKALAARSAAPLTTLSGRTIDLVFLSRAGRPLSYRAHGPVSPLAPAAADGELAARLGELIEMAGPSELMVPENFDPDDPALVWLDPYDRKRISAERAFEIAADVLRHRGRTARRAFAVGLTRWKRPIARAFLDGPNGPPRFGRDPKVAAKAAGAASGRVVAWASRRIDAIEGAARSEGAPFGRLEDGFVRSIGLGAAFIGPLSLVLDEGGIYYDPSRPSDLEAILAEADIPAHLAARAARLRDRLVSESVTKYNVGTSEPPVAPKDRFCVLVPGQVEDDASILKGAGAVRTNLGLLAAARERRPDAFIVYKPHPDVVAGYRVGAVDDAQTRRLADAVVVSGSIAALYPQCSAIETMTSLSGFEGLLRGLEVTTHGQPFYAGWGLTEDLAPHDRRGRRRSLDELVAAALILYPLYCDPKTRLPCGPETALDRLAEQRMRANTPAGRLAARLRHVYALSRHRILGPIARRLS